MRTAPIGVIGAEPVGAAHRMFLESLVRGLDVRGTRKRRVVTIRSSHGFLRGRLTRGWSLCARRARCVAASAPRLASASRAVYGRRTGGRRSAAPVREMSPTRQGAHAAMAWPLTRKRRTTRSSAGVAHCESDVDSCATRQRGPRRHDDRRQNLADRPCSNPPSNFTSSSPHKISAQSCRSLANSMPDPDRPIPTVPPP